MLHGLDHLFAAILVIAWPLYAWADMRKARRRLAADPTLTFDTVSDYRRTIALLVVLALICVLNWGYQAREATTLGLGGVGTLLRWLGGGALALIGLGLAQLQSVQAARQPNTRADLETQLGSIAFLLPKTRRELHWFYGVSLAAGVCEEILFRGFLIWYFAHWLGAVPALLVSSLAFGLAHSYQGLANVPRTAFVGLWLGAIYLISGSLWLAMVAHLVFDVIAGRLIFTVLAGRARPGTTAA